MMTLITYSDGTTQRFFDRSKAEEIVNQLKADGYPVFEDERGGFHINTDADVRASAKSLKLLP